MHISIHKHTSASSILVGLSANSTQGPLLGVGVDVTSTSSTHDIRVEVPPDSRCALGTLISAFRNPNKLVGYVGERFVF